MFLRYDECDGVLMNTSYNAYCPVCGMAIKFDDELGEVISCNCNDLDEKDYFLDDRR